MRKIIKNKVLFFDNCAFDNCNFHCKYCRNLPNPVLNNQQDNKIKKIKTVNRFVSNNVDWVIFKISGYGEITLLKNFIKVLPKNGIVQIITNGSLLTPHLIDILAARKHLHLCISLDGHTIKMNYQRNPNEALQTNLLSNIKYIVEKKIPLEINSVLTKYNISNFSDFLDYLVNLNGYITCYPFPVRIFGEKSNNDCRPTSNMVQTFIKKVVNQYAKYNRVLPPRPYLDRLISFYTNYQRKWPCYAPVFNLGVIPPIDVVKCPCGVNISYGKINSQETYNKRFSVQSNIISTPLNPIVSTCKNCFNHYEIINLYLDNQITLKDLKKISLFNYNRVTNRLAYLKRQVNSLGKDTK